MREAEFAVPHVIAYLKGENRDRANPFDAHQRFVEKGTDNLEDMVDLFWEQPFAFATFVHHRYRAEVTDAFAGRVYESEHQPSICYPAVPQIAQARAGLRTCRTIIPFRSARAIIRSARRYGRRIHRSKRPKNGSNAAIRQEANRASSAEGGLVSVG